MSDRRFRLKYGRTEVEAYASLGAAPQLLIPSIPQPDAKPAAIISNALENPIASPCLGDIVSAGDKVVIVASDTTRATGSHIFLPIVAEELNAAGVPDRDIAIVIALGIHRGQTLDEHRSLLGDRLFERIRPVEHDARDQDNLVRLGATSRGTEVVVNRALAGADKIILTGAVGPHYYAGFGGGRKSVMPGVCSLRAALQSHMLVFNPAPERGRNPDARLARLWGNPVHEDMVEAASMVNPDSMLNTIMSPGHELCAAFAGNFITAHEAACAHYIEHFSMVVDEPADLTIISCGGYPKDTNFIQAHKAIHSAYSVTRPGGWIIVLAECADGLGYPGFIEWFRFENAEQFEERLRANYHIYGQTAYAAFEKATTVNIVMVSELDPADVKRMRMLPAATFEEAYRTAVRRLPRDFLTYVIPAASSTLFFTAQERARALASISRSCRA